MTAAALTAVVVPWPRICIGIAVVLDAALPLAPVGDKALVSVKFLHEGLERLVVADRRDKDFYRDGYNAHL